MHRVSCTSWPLEPGIAHQLAAPVFVCPLPCLYVSIYKHGPGQLLRAAVIRPANYCELQLFDQVLAGLVAVDRVLAGLVAVDQVLAGLVAVDLVAVDLVAAGPWPWWPRSAVRGPRALQPK